MDWSGLANRLEGEVKTDALSTALYATDASIYQEIPMAVVFPKSLEDLQTIVQFAKEEGLSILPRAAGTSLAGQCVGGGIVVDTSYYMNAIIEVNENQKWVRVQPGVVRDELNRFLAPKGLYFGPNTSTSNRCTLGGMVGNNSSGSTSIESGTTRDHVMEVKMVASDGSLVHLRPLSKGEVERRIETSGLEASLYKSTLNLLQEFGPLIIDSYPHPSIHRRNQGYALDALLEEDASVKYPFNLSKLFCGSEGTLGLMYEIKIGVETLPDAHIALVCGHFSSLAQSMEATLLAMERRPSKCELMDKIVLDCTKDNKEQAKNRSFVQGDPAAILMVEFRNSEGYSAQQKARDLAQLWREKDLGYAYPILESQAASKAWDLRAAGLGVLSNVKGSAKPIACIEDTAVRVEDLPAYVEEFERLLKKFKQTAVFYAHAGAGELHLRPLIDLKQKSGVEELKSICEESAHLVKKYRGAISGEHGDGRVRAPFLEIMVGREIVEIWENLKLTWDPFSIFNPNKIVFPKEIDQDLRYQIGENHAVEQTAFDYSEDGGFVMAIEKCNGSGDCKKSKHFEGTMCPSYKASLKEEDSTRARANALRVFLKGEDNKVDFSSKEVWKVLDLCLSCKACKSECPSGVDMATYKSEFLYQHYKINKRPIRDYFLLYFSALYGLGAQMPSFFNWVQKQGEPLIKKMVGIHPSRSLPQLSNIPFWIWWKKRSKINQSTKKTVYLFIDEFTNLLESEIGVATVELLETLGYKVILKKGKESGRAALSKGFLNKALQLAKENVSIYREVVEKDSVLIGIEPSAILGFRHEYPKILRGEEQKMAGLLAKRVYTIEEFLYEEANSGQITALDFDPSHRKIKFHAHCHQKALSEPEKTTFILSLPAGHEVEYINSGCCGMAGSFGFEKEHFAMSQEIGNHVLFPFVNSCDSNTIICASGSSCRHQILDGTRRISVHPIQILREALRKD
jgi:FAD/FMN-containing dehydrogenase/Fe-S oxidoreductase